MIEEAEELFCLVGTRCPFPCLAYDERPGGNTAAQRGLATAASPGSSVRWEGDGSCSMAKGSSTAPSDQKDSRASWGTVWSAYREQVRDRGGRAEASRVRCRAKRNYWRMIMSESLPWTSTTRRRIVIYGCS